MSRLALFAMGAFLTAGVLAEWNFPLPNMYLSDAEGNQLEGTTASQSDRSLLKNFLNSPEQCAHVRRPDGLWCKPAQETPSEPPDEGNGGVPIEPPQEPTNPPVIEPEPAPEPAPEPGSEPGSDPGSEPIDEIVGMVPVIGQPPVNMPLPNYPVNAQSVDYDVLYQDMAATRVAVKGIKSGNEFVVPAEIASNYDTTPDIGRLLSGFKNSSLKRIDHATKRIRTYFDCEDITKKCSVGDIKVGFFARKAVFAVYWFNGVANYTWTLHGSINIQNLTKLRKVQVHILDLESGEITAWDTPDGRIDMHPFWVMDSDGEMKVGISSNRADQFVMYTKGKDPLFLKAIQPYIVNIENTEEKNIGREEDVFTHGYQRRDGRVIGASWKVDEMLGEDQGNGRVTMHNEFWPTSRNVDGSDNYTLINAHGLSMKSKDGSENIALNAFHGGTEIGGGPYDGFNAFADYYRSNHPFSGGKIVVMENLPLSVEVFSLFSVNPQGQETDNPTKRIWPDGGMGGKASWPAAKGDGGLVVTICDGECYRSGEKMSTPEKLVGRWATNAGVYEMPKIPVDMTTDPILIVDEPDRHEWAGVPIKSYEEIYGQPHPDIYTPKESLDENGVPLCTFNSVNALEINFRKPINEDRPYTKIGAALEPGHGADEVVYIGITALYPNTISQQAYYRKQKAIDWEFSWWDLPASGYTETEFLGLVEPRSDGSVSIQVPCSTPERPVFYRLSGHDLTGKKIVKEQQKQWLTEDGEQRVCLGCHRAHHIDEYNEVTQGRTPLDMWKETEAYQLGPVSPLPLEIN